MAIDMLDIYLLITFSTFVLIVLTIMHLLKRILENHYKYPYYFIDIDVSLKRNIDAKDLVESYLLDAGSMYEFDYHHEQVRAWKEATKSKVDRSLLKRYRASQYRETIDDKNEFVFRFNRDQIRYRQKNYVKQSYMVTVVSDTYSCSYVDVREMYEGLVIIGFETTTKKHFCKNQRRLMTKSLRDQIMHRDNFTCQKCGKYMPDKVGLHIDHIVPVSKGGKTVTSNLQVLCSVCNQRKSDRID